MDGLDEVMAHRVRALLSEQGLRHVDLAAGLTALGFDWTPNRVAQIVTGRRPLSLLEAAGICEALGISIDTLLGSAGNVPLPDGNEVAVSDIATALRDGGGGWKGKRTAAQARADKAEAHLAWVAEARQAYAEVHAKAARGLGITEADLEQASLELWGRSLGLERDTRADASTGATGDRATQERRRVATRKLLKELREHLGTTSRETDQR